MAPPADLGATPGLTADVRASILDLVRRCPALHVREIERHLHLPDRLAAYHLSSLQAAGLVERIRERGYVRFYASDAGFTKEELRLARVLRRDQAYRITLLLLRTEAIAPAEIAETIGLSRATVSYHLNLLVKASVLDVRDEGRNRYYSLRDPKRVRRLLHELPPLPGRVDEFSSMWDELVG